MSRRPGGKIQVGSGATGEKLILALVFGFLLFAVGQWLTPFLRELAFPMLPHLDSTPVRLLRNVVWGAVTVLPFYFVFFAALKSCGIVSGAIMLAFVRIGLPIVFLQIVQLTGSFPFDLSPMVVSRTPSFWEWWHIDTTRLAIQVAGIAALLLTWLFINRGRQNTVQGHADYIPGIALSLGAAHLVEATAFFFMHRDWIQDISWFFITEVVQVGMGVAGGVLGVLVALQLQKNR